MVKKTKGRVSIRCFRLWTGRYANQTFTRELDAIGNSWTSEKFKLNQRRNSVLPLVSNISGGNKRKSHNVDVRRISKKRNVIQITHSYIVQFDFVALKKLENGGPGKIVNTYAMFSIS